MRFGAFLRRFAVALLVPGACGPALAQSCTPFTDVPASDTFCSNIQWMFNRGVTLGCGNNQYCPANFVRRDQMAAFLNRLADSLFPLDCAPGQIMKWSGSAWTCASDNSGTGVTPGVFVQGGNAFNGPALLGTTDTQPLHLRVANERAMRFEPNPYSVNVIGGNSFNSVTPGVRGATIAGGGVTPVNTGDPDFDDEAPNLVTDAYGSIGGGYGNRAGDNAGLLIDSPFATVSGGFRNTASGSHSSVAGGSNNTASGDESAVAGGYDNFAIGFASFAAGATNAPTGLFAITLGRNNGADGDHSVAIGRDNQSDAQSSTAIGYNNVAAGMYSVAIGRDNRSDGQSSTAIGNNNVATGMYSVAMGRDNLAQGNYSVALGNRAKNFNHGSFQFADSLPFDYTTSGANNFRVRATGGVRFTTGVDATGLTTWSCVTVEGAGWTCSSDRSLKQNLERLDGSEVLRKLAAMPVYQWQPKGKNAHMKHYGPMAQDFHAAFGLGDDDTMIGFQDADGVALAAIQGLNAKLEVAIAERDARIAEQAREIAAQRAEIAAQRAQIAALQATHLADVSELRRAVGILLARTAPEARLAQLP